MEGDRRRSEHSQHERRAPRLPEGPPPEPARHELRHDPARTGRRPRHRAFSLTRHEPRGAGPGRRRRLRLARRPLAPERTRDPGVARRSALLGRGARALAGPRQDDRHRLPRRAARHSAACRAPGTDRHDHAHDRRLRARARHARALAVHRSRPALPLAQPRLGPARRRDRRLGLLGPLAPSPRARARPPPSPPRPHARLPLGPTGRAFARCSRSASPAGSCRAPRLSSSCWLRSRCTGWRSACS